MYVIYKCHIWTMIQYTGDLWWLEEENEWSKKWTEYMHDSLVCKTRKQMGGGPGSKRYNNDV